MPVGLVAVTPPVYTPLVIVNGVPSTAIFPAFEKVVKFPVLDGKNAVAKPASTSNGPIGVDVVVIEMMPTSTPSASPKYNAALGLGVGVGVLGAGVSSFLQEVKTIKDKANRINFFIGLILFKGNSLITPQFPIYWVISRTLERVLGS